MKKPTLGAEILVPNDDMTTLVLVALHQDLYNADYLVYEIGLKISDEIYFEIAKDLGCELP